MNNNNKGNNMTNLKKLGLSALAGSLVAVSAQAGEMTVSGKANVVYKTGNSGVAPNGGKTFGTDKDVAFTGTGEMDNGWTFTFNTTLDDAYDVSSSYTSLTMGSLGTISAGTDTGGASYKYDEEVPQAYEQTSDAQQNSANVVGNQMDSNSLVYHSPSFEIAGLSLSFDGEFSPNANGLGAGDGAQTAKITDGNNFGKGYGLGVTAKFQGLSVGVYGNERENRDPQAVDKVRDAVEGVWYAKYAIGPVSFGYSESYLDSGLAGADVAADVAKSLDRTATGIFESESYSIAYNVNENLSVSYTSTEDTYDDQDHAGTAIADVSQDSTAIQIAYSMGAMSLKAYQMETKNPGYDNDADKENVTEIALGLAF